MSKTGIRIKERRKELGITADQLADRVGISRSTIFRYENGDIEKVPADLINKFAEVLSVSPAHLMGWEDNSPVIIAAHAHLNTDGLSQEDLDDVANYIEFIRNRRKKSLSPSS